MGGSTVITYFCYADVSQVTKMDDNSVLAAVSWVCQLSSASTHSFIAIIVFLDINDLKDVLKEVETVC